MGYNMSLASHRSARARLLGASALPILAALAGLALGVGAAAAQTAAPEAPTAPAADAVTAVQEVVVTARNRTEKLQDVPIPITAVSGAVLERENAISIKDFTQKVPNVLVNAPNARQTSIAIRGLGKNTANDALEASVGVIVDNVVAGHVGMSWVNYVDVDQIELLRGPQGTLLGKNTTLGVLNVTTRRPSFEPDGSLEVSYGERDSLQVKASATGPILDDALAFRVSAWVDNREGFLENRFKTGESFLGSGKWGVRGQLLFERPNFNARIIGDHTQTDERINVNPSWVDPATFADGSARSTTFTTRLGRSWFGGYAPVIGSYDELDLNSAQPLKTEQNGLSAELNWDLGGYTLTSISAWRAFDFDAKNDTDLTRFDIMNYNGTLVDTEQETQEIRLASPADRRVDWQVGLFGLRTKTRSEGRNFYGDDAGAFYASNAQYNALNATPEGRLALQDALGGVYVGQIENPETKSFAVYGQANWHVTDRLTVTAGLRNTWEQKDNVAEKVIRGGADLAALYSGSVLSNAQAIRTGRVKTPFGPIRGEGIDDSAVSWLFSPSFKLSEDVLLYASAAYGEKSGAVQFDQDTGAPQNVDPEKVHDYELGLKTRFFDRRLLLNINAYWTKVEDYQAQLTTLIDPTTAKSYLGNVGEVEMKGVEIEGAADLGAGFGLTFSGAYNDAKYESFTNSPCALEVSNIAQVCDLTGQTISGAPKVVANIGLNWEHALANGVELYAYVNDSYRSKANLNSSLSIYGVQDAYHIANAGVGVRSPGGRYELGLWAKNLGDTLYNTNIGSGSGTGAFTFTPGERRQVAVVLKARF